MSAPRLLVELIGGPLDGEVLALEAEHLARELLVVFQSAGHRYRLRGSRVPLEWFEYVWEPAA